MENPLTPEEQDALEPAALNVQECIGLCHLSMNSTKPFAIDESLAAKILTRSAIAQAEGLSMLLRQARVEPAETLLRSLFEIYLQLLYLGEADRDTRARNFLAEYWHQMSDNLDRVDARTIAGSLFASKCLRDACLSGLQGEVPPVMLDEARSQLKEWLGISWMPAALAEVRNARQAKGHTKWYAVNNGPKSVKALASKLLHEATYDYLYSKYSEATHGASTMSLIRESPNSVHLNPLRHAVRAVNMEPLARSFLTKIAGESARWSGRNDIVTKVEYLYMTRVRAQNHAGQWLPIWKFHVPPGYH